MNVWEILGLPPTSDQAAIKRAYAAQLKLHKPQVDPEGFQHLREAYTWALRWGDRFEQDAWDHEDEDQDAEVPPAADANDRHDDATAGQRRATHDPTLSHARTRQATTDATEHDVPAHAPDSAGAEVPPAAAPGDRATNPATPPHDAPPPMPHAATSPQAAANPHAAATPHDSATSHAAATSHDAANPHATAAWHAATQPSTAESSAAAEERLLAAFDALTHLNARKDVRTALQRWLSDPALDHFDVRRALSVPVFERTIAWLLENAKRRRALLAAPEFVQPLDHLFDWRSDELELEREFGDDVETVFVVLDPTRALQSDRRPVGASSWPTLKRAFAMIGLLVGLTIGIDQWMREARPPRPPEPLSAAEAAYDDGDYERAITLAEQARAADDYERGQLVVRALLALDRLDAARARAEALVAESPGLPDAHLLLGDVYTRLGRCPDANTHYDRAQAIAWSVDAGNSLAWGLATCPEPEARDGARAVTIAKRVVHDRPIAIYIDTHAAALAEHGDFEAAVREQQRALGSARNEGLDDDVIQGMRERLFGFQQRRAYHRPPPPQPPSQASNPG